MNNDMLVMEGEELYELLLKIEVDDFKEQLVDLIHYDRQPKRKFLKKLSEFRFSSIKNYSNEDYEYKVLDLVSTVLNENEYQIFRNEFVIETSEKKF